MRSLLLAIAFLLCVVVRAAEPVEITADLAFAGQAAGGVVPVIVTLRNRGPALDARVVVRPGQWNEDQRRYVYPVHLPNGTVKRITAYPETTEYGGGPSVTLESRRYPDIEATIRQEYRSGNTEQIGLIGDDIGGLAALRTNQSESGTRRTSQKRGFTDCYCRPEDAPDRAAGYDGLSRLVIGEGAERMNRAQWQAIRLWAVSGGSVIFLGGAGASYLRLPDVAPLLPLRNVRAAAVRNLALQGLTEQRVGAAIVPVTFAGQTAVATGTRAPGSDILQSQAGMPVVSRRIVGAGAVLLLGLTPLEQPLRGSPALPALWNRWVAQSRPTVLSGELMATVTGRQTTRRANGGAAGDGVNAFEMQLPPTRYIVLAFLAYFLLAIPVTYLALRRLGRLELAWFTGPVLGVVFAFVFYFATSELYMAGRAQRTTGTIYYDPQLNAARFTGYTDFFLPRGGSYAIAPPGAETLKMGVLTGDRSYGYGGEANPATVVDTGEPAVPELAVTNLSFRRVNYAAPVTDFGTVTATLKRDRRRGVTGTVRNGTRHALRGCRLVAGQYGTYRVGSGDGDLAPGETGRLQPVRGNPLYPSLLANISINLQSQSLSPLPGEESRTFASAILVGETVPGEIGPRLGRDLSNDRSVLVVVSLPVEESR